MSRKKAVTEHIMPAQYARAKGLSRQRIYAMIKAKHPAIETKKVEGRVMVKDAEQNDIL